ncbi:iron complex transport system substrate-binding protein [Marinactinospora thermotolerans DSM 45154]|uniref:Iron complex transport system substrate-binding protein n=1 Tax=Marinactinospora thermotolerans DSM 45154 TaxID=1122192 RepID=A0A1T4SXE0_9ACTN|nr:iron-siderophore ABC transporter substrate-binding protein [Marinactinospora thermotolerans]SKA32930.1 iron complex transport system substrate-binding protein [Marinactinospora thermotolerans DSM 45154]
MLFSHPTGRRVRGLRAGAVAAVAAIALSSCGTDTTEEETAAPSGEGSGAFPVTIEHAFGSTEITEKPERVVTVGWSDEGTLLALDIVPVGIAESTFGAREDGLLEWDAEKLEELGGEKPTLISNDDGIPVEQVASLAPDLILGVQSGLEENQYEQLSQIAPTIPYLDKPWQTAWQDQTVAVGRSVGMEEEAQQLVDDTNAYIDGIAEQHPQFAEKTFAFGTVTQDGQLAFYIDGEPRAEVMKQLGFAPAGITEQLDVAEGQFFGTTSMENADKVDADVMVMWYNSADAREAAEANPVFQQIPAVQDGGYVAFDDDAVAMAMSAVSPLSLPWAVDQFLPDLVKAAEGKA